ncbi:hypothetical protein [Kocuria sabuli]|uniref:hypothetical protein n=1 Tax=Kocuria sabuli TaxID=3071448 RepID=UPI0034D422E6
MRQVGTGALGLVGGVLLALIVQDLLAVAFLQDGTIPIALGILLGLLMPVLGMVGAGAAVLIDNRYTKRRSRDTPGV